MDIAGKYLTLVIEDDTHWTLWAHVDSGEETILVYAVGVSDHPGDGIWIKPELIMLQGDRRIEPDAPLIEFIPWRVIRAITSAEKKPAPIQGFRPRT